MVMDSSLQERSADGVTVFRFPRDRIPCTDLTDDFAPLRLRMRPGSICLEFNESGLLMGRHSSADVRLSLPDVSRQHCRFLFADGQWEVLDLNSLNGIYINGERLQRSVLCHGDMLRIAGLSFEVQIAGVNNSAQPQPDSAAVIQRIADALPSGPEMTQEYRKAS
jgi:predicted component of type VI protein secretion system